MESLVGNEFDVPSKNSSEEALKRWRQAVTILKNPRRRFRYCADLEKRRQAEQKKLSIQEKIRVALYVQKAALQFIDAGSRVEYMLSEEVRQAGFGIDPNELASIVRGHDSRRLKQHGEVGGIARKVSVSLENGVISKELPVRQNIYGSNKYVEKPPRSLWVFIWEALQDLTLIILMVCAVVSVGVGIATEGLPKGIYDGLGIILCIFLVVMVTAISDYKQSLQFRDLDKEKKNISIHVTRDGYRQKVSIHDLVVGDIVHLSIGDVVPADGMYISGYSLLIDESSLSGESEPVNVNHSKPFLLSGTSVRNGSGKMLVTAVGMRTEWGRLMETLSESGENETPLQVKLNGVATLIGKIGLAFAVMTFLVLVVRFLVEKGLHSELLKWSLSDVVEILNYFAIAVTIIVVAVPEGLPLAVTLSLAFAMKKLMSDHALVRHLSACETMGSVTSICTDKTGTLTTNHMIVDKIWICESVKGNNIMNALKSTVSEEVLRTLLQCIFQNTSAEVVEGKDGKTKILGSPTESALIEFGSFLGGDYGAQRRESKIVKIEPFNSDRKKMSVLVALQRGRFRAFCKGASELVVQMCDKIIDSKGESVHLSKSKIESGMEVINSFACEALRTLCLAFKDLNENNGNNIPDHGYTLIAVIGIKDPLRPHVKDAVQTCLSAGVTVRMVTGDNINTAKAIAKECGILTEGGLAIEGQEFRQWTPQQIKESISIVQVMARSLPMDKHAFVTQLRNLDEVVAVTGDGTNDAPALHEADIGLAMGIEGTEVAKENADVIIMDDNFTSIVNLAKWGRAVYINIQKFVQFQLTVNIVALMTNFISACVSGAAPLTAVQLLWVNMIMDTLGALALATDPPNDEMMKRPPVGKGVNIITGPMWKNIIGQSIYQLAILSILTFCGKGVLRFLRLGGWNSSSVLNTLIFNTFVLCQVFNEINCRDIEKINVFRGMLNNWIFIAIMVSTVTFQIIIVEFLGTFASTVPLSWQLWLFSVLIGAISLPVGVVLKLIPCKSSINGNTTKHHDGYEELPSGPEMA